VLMSAVSMFFYFRLVVAMYLRDGKDAEVSESGALKFVAAVCLVVTLILGVFPTPLINRAEFSSRWIAMRAAMTPDARR
jgi:NADH-quinone oxidoreductase subunit N